MLMEFVFSHKWFCSVYTHNVEFIDHQNLVIFSYEPPHEELYSKRHYLCLVDEISFCLSMQV